MTLTAGITAMIIGILAYGMGKLSVYVGEDQGSDSRHTDDSFSAWEPDQIEIWSKARENEVMAERELAKQVSTLSFTSIAGVLALGQLKIVGTTGVVLLIVGFFLPIFFCIANLQLRQSLFSEHTRRLHEAFENGRSPRRRSSDAIKHRMVAGLPKVGAILFGISLVLISFTLPAKSVDCAARRPTFSFYQLYCSGLVQTLAARD